MFTDPDSGGPGGMGCTSNLLPSLQVYHGPGGQWSRISKAEAIKNQD